MGITKQVASIPSYRPASSAGLTSCAKRITPTLTPYLTPILIQNSKCHEKQEHLGTDPEGHCGRDNGCSDCHYDHLLYGLWPNLKRKNPARDGRGFFPVLQLHEDAGVYHAACQVVGDGVLMVRDVRYPVVAADVVEAEDVEAVQA